MKCIGLWTVLALMHFAQCNTNDKYDRDALVRMYNEARKYDTGQFQSDEFAIDDTQLRSTNEHQLIIKIRNVCMLQQLSFTYNMLMFIYLNTPKAYWEKNGTYVDINRVCPRWEQKMLKTRIETNYFNQMLFTSFAWVFNIYTSKMKLLSTMDENEERNLRMNRLYVQVLNFIKDALPHDLAKTQLDSEKLSKIYYNRSLLDLNAELENLKKSCKLQTLSDADVDDMEFDRLFLNNIIEKDDVMNTILTGFVGSIDRGGEILHLLSDQMTIVKNPNTALDQNISSLQTVYRYFIQMVSTMMLRLCWAFLNDLNVWKDIHTTMRVDEFVRHLVQFVEFFALKSMDHFGKLIDLFKNWSTWYSVMPSKPKSTIIVLLRRYDYYGPLIKMGNDDYKSLEKIDVKTCNFDDTKKEAKPGNSKNISKEPIPDSTLCAKMFVGYLQKELEGVNFNAIQMFIKEEFEFIHVSDLF